MEQQTLQSVYEYLLNRHWRQPGYLDACKLIESIMVNERQQREAEADLQREGGN